MIAKKMLTWIGAGMLSAVAIPAMAVGGHKLVHKIHAAHGSAKATVHYKTHAKASSKASAAPVHHTHRTTGKTGGQPASKTSHAKPASQSFLGVTSMHSGKSNAALGKSIPKTSLKSTPKASKAKIATAKGGAKAHVVTFEPVAPRIGVSIPPDLASHVAFH